jgi:hypothetical protein
LGALSSLLFGFRKSNSPISKCVLVVRTPKRVGAKATELEADARTTKITEAKESGFMLDNEQKMLEKEKYRTDLQHGAQPTEEGGAAIVRMKELEKSLECVKERSSCLSSCNTTWNECPGFRSERRAIFILARS